MPSSQFRPLLYSLHSSVPGHASSRPCTFPSILLFIPSLTNSLEDRLSTLYTRAHGELPFSAQHSSSSLFYKWGYAINFSYVPLRLLLTSKASANWFLSNVNILWSEFFPCVGATAGKIVGIQNTQGALLGYHSVSRRWSLGNEMSKAHKHVSTSALNVSQLPVPPDHA